MPDCVGCASFSLRFMRLRMFPPRLLPVRGILGRTCPVFRRKPITGIKLPPGNWQCIMTVSYTHLPRDLNEYVGKVYEFKIVKVNDDRKNIVLSRREVIEAERCV